MEHNSYIAPRHCQVIIFGPGYVWFNIVHCGVVYTSTTTAFVLTRWKLFLTDASDTLSGSGRGQLAHAPDCTSVCPPNPHLPQLLFQAGIEVIDELEH